MNVSAQERPSRPALDSAPDSLVHYSSSDGNTVSPAWADVLDLMQSYEYLNSTEAAKGIRSKDVRGDLLQREDVQQPQTTG